MTYLSRVQSEYEVTAAGEMTLIAWEFPPRTFKKMYEAMMPVLKRNGIDAQTAIGSHVPHVSLIYTYDLTKQEEDGLKKLAPSQAGAFKITGLDFIPGQGDRLFIAAKTDLPPAFLDFYNNIVARLGVSRVKVFPQHRPHASILLTTKANLQKVEALKGELEKAVQQYAMAFTPTNLQFWRDMQVAELYEF